jgi:uncharacterized protein YjiK
MASGATQGFGDRVTRRAAVFLIPCLLCCEEQVAQVAESSALSRYSFTAEAATQWRLPGRLREISGLATTPDGRLFAHDDEQAIIYQVDYSAGRVVKAFALGDITQRDDFEGLAVADGKFYLVSSYGRLYEAAEGADDERMLFNTYGTGVGRQCEVEGLAFEPADRALLLLCKTVRTEELEDFVVIYKWSLDRRSLTADSPLRVPLEAVTDHIKGKSFNPSGIEIHPLTRTYVVVAAKQEVIVEITPAGEVRAVVELPGKVHRQVEGIAFLPVAELLLGDEGQGGRGRLTLYSPTRQ